MKKGFLLLCTIWLLLSVQIVPEVECTTADLSVYSCEPDFSCVQSGNASVSVSCYTLAGLLFGASGLLVLQLQRARRQVYPSTTYPDNHKN